MKKDVESHLLETCYTAASMRRIDRRVADYLGISEYQLMISAGERAYSNLCERWPDAQRIIVLCGTGNNGGDGWVLARLAVEGGLDCTVYLLGDPVRISGPAREAYQAWLSLVEKKPKTAKRFLETGNQQCDVIVDALVGIGLKNNQRQELSDLIDKANENGSPIFALDAPSGLNADTGELSRSVIRASATLTFIAHKPGLLTGKALDYVGSLSLEPLGVIDRVLKLELPTARIVNTKDLCLATLPPRLRAAHKGHFGHVVVIGGNYGMAGAAIMAAHGALRGGAGLVSLVSRPEHMAVALARHPEIMFKTLEDLKLSKFISNEGAVLVVGPGLGLDAWANNCLKFALDSEIPTIFDADALNLLATLPTELLNISSIKVITPHPGEAARLAGLTTDEIESDRIDSARLLSERFESTVILKGAGTVIASHQNHDIPVICQGGNPGMATGGMGDVLAGLSGALLAQGVDAFEACQVAVTAHARAGDAAWCEFGIGLTASDVAERLGATLMEV